MDYDNPGLERNLNSAMKLKVAEHSFVSYRVYVICQIHSKRKVAAHKLKLGN